MDRMEPLAEIEAQQKKLKADGLKTKADQKRYRELVEQFKKVYRMAKKRAMDFEQNNRQYLVLVRSDNGYFKMFEYSALFYAYSLAPQMNISAVLREDTDYFSKSKIGSVSIKEPENLTTPFEKLNIVPISTKDDSGNLLVFKMPWVYDDAEVKQLLAKASEKLQRFNRLVMTDNTIPVLFLQLTALHKTLYENVCSMSGPVSRESYGIPMLKMAAEMQCLYLEYANGKIHDQDFFDPCKKWLNSIKYRVKIVSELKIWKPDQVARIADSLIEVSNILDSEQKSRAKKK